MRGLERVRGRWEWHAKYAADGGDGSLAGADAEHSRLLEAKRKVSDVQVEIATVQFELDEVHRENAYDLEGLEAQKAELEGKVARKQARLDQELSRRDAAQAALNDALKSGRAEELRVTIRNMRNAELLCRHAKENRAAYADEAQAHVNRTKKKFANELRTKYALDSSQGYL